jgi:hypothetical protein
VSLRCERAAIVVVVNGERRICNATPECGLFQSAAFRNPSQGLLYLGASIRFCAGEQPPDMREPGEMDGSDPSVTEMAPFNPHSRGNGCRRAARRCHTSGCRTTSCPRVVGQ